MAAGETSGAVVRDRRIFSKRWLTIVILLGYLGAAAFYSSYFGINVGTSYTCPQCPFVDVFGGGLQTFLVLTAIFGTMNAFLLVVPILALMACKTWSLRIRRELPGLRAATGMAAILLTALGWLLMYPLAFLLWRVAPGLDHLRQSSVVPTIALGTVTAMALSGKPRVYLALAGLGMLALCRFFLGLSL